MKAFVALISAACAVSSVFAQQPSAKKKVAVLDFQYATVMSSVQAIFGTSQDIGRGISDLVQLSVELERGSV